MVSSVLGTGGFERGRRRLDGPVRVFRCIRARIDELTVEEGATVSEREAARRSGLSTGLWSYYFKKDRREIIPLRVLEQVADGLRMGEDGLEALKEATLEDFGWRVSASSRT